MGYPQSIGGWTNPFAFPAPGRESRRSAQDFLARLVPVGEAVGVAPRALARQPRALRDFLASVRGGLPRRAKAITFEEAPVVEGASGDLHWSASISFEHAGGHFREHAILHGVLPEDFPS